MERMKIMESLVSVIVPMYNSSRTIERCLNSITNQTYKKLEIIVINDGSTDGSLDILFKFQKRDSRIVVIEKENEGVSAARNDGIKRARGEYILFVDSDDYIDVKAIEVLMNIVYCQQTDGVVFGYRLEGNANWMNDSHVLKALQDSFGKAVSSEIVLRHVLTINPAQELLGYSVRYLYKMYFR